MGYYTRYRLTTENDGAVDPLLRDTRAKATLKQMSGYTWDGDDLDDEVKWYDWERHLSKTSETFPDVIFILSGEGEENGDIWKAYARNGDVEKFSADTTVVGKPAWMGGDAELHNDAILVSGDDHSFRKATVREIDVVYSINGGYFEYVGDDCLEMDEIVVKMKVIDG